MPLHTVIFNPSPDRIIPLNPLIHMSSPIYNHPPYILILTASRLLILLPILPLCLRILPSMCSFSLYIYLNLSSIAFYVVSIFFYIKPLMMNTVFLQIKKVGIVWFYTHSFDAFWCFLMLFFVCLLIPSVYLVTIYIISSAHHSCHSIYLCLMLCTF